MATFTQKEIRCLLAKEYSRRAAKDLTPDTLVARFTEALQEGEITGLAAAVEVLQVTPMPPSLYQEIASRLLKLAHQVKE